MMISKKRKLGKMPGISSKLVETGLKSNWAHNLFHSKFVYPFSSARSSLFYAWKSMNLPKGDEILIPSFICNSVSEPLIEAGAKIKYFKVLPDGNYDWEELASLDLSNVKVFLWVHFLGLAGDFSEALKFCKSKRLYLLEDCSHALLTTYKNKTVGSFGDVACFSLRKCLPVLGGGVLQINNPKFNKPFLNINKNPQVGDKARQDGERLEYFNYLRSIQSWQVNGGDLLYKEVLPNIDFILNDKRFPYELDQISQNIINNIDFCDLKRKVRRNFKIYFKHLKPISLFNKLDTGDVPIGFPVIVKNRDAFRSELERHDILPTCHWPDYLLPDGVAKQFPDTLKLANSILTLPCHQDLSTEDITYACEVIKNLLLEEKNYA